MYFHYYHPVDTGRKLNVQKTFRKRPGRLLNVLCTFNLRPVSTGQIHLNRTRFQLNQPQKMITQKLCSSKNVIYFGSRYLSVDSTKTLRSYMKVLTILNLVCVSTRQQFWQTRSVINPHILKKKDKLIMLPKRSLESDKIMRLLHNCFRRYFCLSGVHQLSRNSNKISHNFRNTISVDSII